MQKQLNQQPMQTPNVQLLTSLQIVNPVFLPSPEVPALFSVWYTLYPISVCLYSWTLMQHSLLAKSSMTLTDKKHFCLFQKAKLTTNVALARPVSTAAALTEWVFRPGSGAAGLLHNAPICCRGRSVAVRTGKPADLNGLKPDLEAITQGLHKG